MKTGANHCVMLRAAVAWCLTLILALLSVQVLAQGVARTFDHIKTGYPLTGVHASERCESCHINGIFKGTPRDCASCHTSGLRLARNNVVKPQQHVPSQLACDTCHSTKSFVGAKFSHTGVVAGTCANCHNGGITVGKPAGHLPTQAACDSCHASSAWRPATKFDHGGVTPASCATCHNGSKASGKSATHIPYQSLTGVNIASCDSCHKSGFAAWEPAKFHANVSITNQCASCHTGNSPTATGKPNTPIHTGVTACESCHKSTSSFKGAKVDHSTFTVATNCASCHNGSSATGKSATHMPVAATNCINCHSTSGWKPTQWNHQQVTVANACSTCHTGGFPPASGKSATHIPYQTLTGAAIANCDSCHKGGFAAWEPAKFHANVAVSGQCASCHSGSSPTAMGKPNTPIHTGVTACESCHKSTSSFKGAKVDHSTFTVATNCASCHDGSSATGKSATHIPVAATNCANCHATSNWAPAKWNHTQTNVANSCSTCHTGGFPPADGKSATHIPYQTLSGVAISNCDSCHKSGFGTWAPAKFHSNVSVAGQCASCHTGGFAPAVGKPATPIHASVTGNCESCHKTTSSWAGAKVDHSTFTVATNCSSCHNGSSATGKSATHIPVAATNCISCHNTSGWVPTKWNHSQLTVSNACSTCHTGGFPPADGKSSSHIPYQTLSGVAIANCDSCHKSGYSAWAPSKFHANVTLTSQCSSCHLTGAYGLSSKPATPIHASVTGNCESCHKTTSSWAGAKVDHSTFTVATNCSSCHNGSSATGKSATHIPVAATNCISCHNTSGWVPTKWNHSQLTVSNACSTCHTGGFPPADGKSSSHIPYQTLSGVAIANCDSCHKSGYSAWAPSKFHANATLTSQCSSCHLTGAYGLTSKPATPIHASVTGNCESCHKTTSSWAGAKVDHSTLTVATNCASCHNGSSATGKSATHIPVAATNCISCHNTSGWVPTKWNHSQLTVSNACSTCHTGGFPPADGKSSSHIPYQTLSGVAIANCDSCHKSGYSAWAPSKFHANVTLTSQCSSCHLTGAYGLTSKPATPIHASVTGNCESCHKTTSSWAGAKVDHSTFTVATNCASCHNGSSATGKSATHIPVAATNCISCHNTSGWVPTKWNHSQLTVSNACSTCHTGGFPPADGKSSSHIPYQTLSGVAIANCDSCHKSGYSAWAPSKFHANATLTSQCSSCHLTGAYGLTSKPATPIHASVTGNCESCHKTTSSWAGAKVDHSTFTVATNCASCHNGSSATGKSATHIPVAATNCISCHNTSGWVPTKWNHSQLTVSNTCSTCHTGGFPPADGKTVNHIPYQTLAGVAISNCDSCHKSGYSAWAPSKFHSSVSISTQCSTCHLTGTYGLTSKPATAVHASVTGNCESCHKTTSSWAGAKVDHSTFTVATNCASCHNGSTATGKSATHIPMGATTCGTCHNTTGWVPTKWNHSQLVVANQCSTCHTGGYPPADGKTVNHIPYQTLAGVAISNCDSCHKSGYASWNPGRFHTNVSIGSQCSSCHLTGAYGLTSKPATAVHATVTGNCESCHKTTSSWAGAKVDHSTFTVATNCASCHNGSTATGKSATHIPVGATTCGTCHNTTGWVPTKWNHSQLVVVNQCSTCHTGGYPPADGRKVNHIPYQTLAGVAITNCDSCHKSGYSAWVPAKFHGNVSISSQCSSCHLTGTYGLTSKPANATHATVTGNCESCHASTTSWSSGVKFTHSAANAVGTGTCDTCHNGSTAKGKTPTHIPVTTGVSKCDSCHRSQTSFATAVTMNHSVVTGSTCKSCHNGSYTTQGATGALAKPANHIPEVQLLNGASMDCNTCHTSTSSWGSARMNHNASMGNGAGWCKACHASGTSYLGSMEKKSLTHEAKSTPPTDCSQSGCHRPLGSKGVAYSKWD